MRTTYPASALAFRCVNDPDVFNDYWAGSDVELIEFDAVDHGFCIWIRRADHGHGAFGRMTNVDGLEPLTDAARELVAIITSRR